MPYWAGDVAKAQNGGFMIDSVTSNTKYIREWLRTKVPTTTGGETTKGITMVESIWGTDIAKKFANEEIVLIAEPIAAVQFGQYQQINVIKFDSNTSLEEMLTRFNTLLGVMSSAAHTELSPDLEERITYYRDRINTLLQTANKGMLPTSALYNERANIAEDMKQLSGRINIYFPLGDIVAGTSKDIYEYYNSLTPGKGGNGVSYTKSPMSQAYWRKQMNACTYVEVGSIVCAKTNFNLWNGGKSGARKNHTIDTIRTYSLGMLAMLAWHSDGDPLQSTWDQPTTTPHPAPQESTGNVTIIKSYRTVDSTTNIPISDDGTFTKSDVANIIQIEDEPIYRLVEWRISNSPKPDNLTSLNWETTVPSHIHSTGTKETTVTLPPTHTYLYVLLEKSIGDEPIEANYLLSQSSISRHINLNTPDQSQVAGKDMKLLSTITFKWNIGAHHECTGHVYYTRCGGTHGCGQRRYCSSPCGDTNGDGKVNKNDAPCGGHDCGADAKHPYCAISCTNDNCQKHTAYCSGFQWTDSSYSVSLERENLNEYQYVIASNAGYNTLTTQLNTGWPPITFNSAGVTRSNHKVGSSTSASGLSFHTVVHRGNTKIVVADWKNNNWVKSELKNMSVNTLEVLFFCTFLGFKYQNAN